MSTLRASRRRFASRKGLTSQGFTLIEILVVLSIAAIVTAITVGGFREMTAGNKRVSCQSNLAQIYQACRLYASDEGGKFPLLATISGTSAPQAPTCPIYPPDANRKGIGLWSLYTFPDSSFSGPDSTRPIERYIRSGKILHCPQDFTVGHGNLIASGTNLLDAEYLSYQTCDGTTPTYSSVRTTLSTDANWKRQLMSYSGTSLIPRPPDDKTIVTYCIYHRGSRNLDNVLFYDGSVQLLPNQGAASNWYRDPKAPQ